MILSTFILVSNLEFKILGSLASESCYEQLTKLIWNVLRRPMRFFDTTASGVIQNRCTDDVEIVDIEVSDTLTRVVPFLVIFLSTLSLSIVITPVIIAPMVVLAYILSDIIRKYLRAGIELLRLNRVSLSPR